MADEKIDLNKYLVVRNACIYSNERKRLSASLLRRVIGVTDVSTDSGFFTQPSYFSFRIGSCKIRLNANFDQNAIKDHVRGMHGWVDAFHSISPIQNLQHFHGYIDQISQMYGVLIETEFAFNSPPWNALLRVCEPIDGVIFTNESFIDCDGRILFGYLADLIVAAQKDRDDS